MEHRQSCFVTYDHNWKTENSREIRETFSLTISFVHFDVENPQNLRRLLWWLERVWKDCTKQQAKAIEINGFTGQLLKEGIFSQFLELNYSNKIFIGSYLCMFKCITLIQYLSIFTSFSNRNCINKFRLF